MCFVETPSNSSPKQALQCPPTPRKYRVTKSNHLDDPLFFPSSSSILGSSTCATESTCDTSVESLLDSINALPVTVLVLKPKHKSSHGEARTSRRRKLSISDIKGDIPPLPYKVTHKKQMDRSTSDPNQVHKKNASGVPSSKIEMNAAPMRRMSIKNLPGPRRLSMNARCAWIHSTALGIWVDALYIPSFEVVVPCHFHCLNFVRLGPHNHVL